MLRGELQCLLYKLSGRLGIKKKSVGDVSESVHTTLTDLTGLPRRWTVYSVRGIFLPSLFTLVYHAFVMSDLCDDLRACLSTSVDCNVLLGGYERILFTNRSLL